MRSRRYTRVVIRRNLTAIIARLRNRYSYCGLCLIDVPYCSGQMCCAMDAAHARASSGVSARSTYLGKRARGVSSSSSTISSISGDRGVAMAAGWPSASLLEAALNTSPDAVVLGARALGAASPPPVAGGGPLTTRSVAPANWITSMLVNCRSSSRDHSLGWKGGKPCQ